MTMTIVKLYDEVAIMEKLKDGTLTLIQATTLIKAIKKLIEAHDIIELNLIVEKNFKNNEGHPTWDIPALIDLSKIRRELFVYYRTFFNPQKLFDNYNKDMTTLLNIITLRNSNLTDRFF